MDVIRLKQIIPHVFQDRSELRSEVWNQIVEFKKGEFYMLEAVSGAGKSSLCSYIYGYRNDYQGTIAFDHQDIRMLKIDDWVKVRKSSLSILFQELRLFPELTTWENIKLKNALTHYRYEHELEEWFDRLGIADKRNAKVETLSWGQQQRVAFIRALCQPFDFIFLDEPISHMDEENVRIMSQILRDEVRKHGAGLILTSIGKHLSLDYSKTLRL